MNCEQEGCIEQATYKYHFHGCRACGGTKCGAAPADHYFCEKHAFAYIGDTLHGTFERLPQGEPLVIVSNDQLRKLGYFWARVIEKSTGVRNAFVYQLGYITEEDWRAGNGVLAAVIRRAIGEQAERYPIVRALDSGDEQGEAATEAH